METLIIPAIVLLGIPLLLLFLFKANAGVMFLAACAGIVLLLNLDPTVVTTAGAVIPGEGEAYIRLSVVLLAILFAAMMFRDSVRGTSMILHATLVFFLAGMLWIVLPQATGVSWLINSIDESYWITINDFRSLIIAIGFSLSLFAVLTSKHRKKKHHK